MNSIQFESAREKEKARAALREARDHMLEQAKKRAELRAEREADKILKGESNWLLPSLDKKLKRKIKDKKRHKKKDAKNKKYKKKSSKKKRHSSSSEDESDDSSSTSDSTSSSLSSTDEEKLKKISNKSKSKLKQKKSSKISCPSESSYNDNNGSRSEWVEAKQTDIPIKRDSWMVDSLMLKTYSKERTKTPVKEKQQTESYDPIKSSRELNPYWKSTGTGLPAFQRPRDDEDEHKYFSNNSKNLSSTSSNQGWKKQNPSNEKTKKPGSFPPIRSAMHPRKDATSSDETSTDDEKLQKVSVSISDFLTDQQMNELGAKILKAEIMGNLPFAEDLRQKLENARKQRNLFKDRKRSEVNSGPRPSSKASESKKKQEEYVLLTRTDQSGQSRPIKPAPIDPRDLYGGKSKKKRVQTHDSDGQRVRYFADDDRISLKDMFEREKMTTVSDANKQFAAIASKNKNPNDDLEDIFSDKICHDESTREAHRDKDRAIREHQRTETLLDNCDKCFDSAKLQKELLVAIGDKVYLTLPWYQGLQPGHCLIVPTQHSTCSTNLDEDTWTEINDFRKALTKMFAAQRKDVIFFEIANRLHKRPHLVIHCIPIKDSEGEMAPFYFKKAIEESEHEWSVNKQLVSLRNKSLRCSIPKGLPYFWVNFGMNSGFAHVIEDEDRFPPNFALEIIGGMLHLDANKWRKKQKEINIITKVKMFADWWKKYDCTK